MKRINLILMTLALCLFGACDEGLDDLEGTFDMDIYNFTRASVGETEYISSSLKVLNVVLSDESGNSMDIDFGSSAYVLPEATYSYSSSISAAKQYNGVLNGSTSFSGDIDVVLVDSVYYFTGLLSYSSGETFKMTYKGVIAFEEGEDEGSELTELTQLVSASSNVASGTNSVSLILATAGVEATYYADYYSWYYGGTGYYLAVDFYSEDGYLYEGTYSPSSSGTPEAGCYVIGYDPGDIYGWGYSFTDWGTCWWTVDNGTTTAEKITSGNITVTKSGSTYTITVDNTICYAQYKGAIDALNPTAEAPATELTQLVSASSNVASGTNSVSLILATADVEATYYADYYSWYYGGTGYYLAVDFYSEDGYLYPGTYSPSTDGTPESGCYVIGYDPGDIYGWGYSFTDWGTCWWTVDNGTTTAEKITSGNITVTKSGSTYTITVDNTICYAKYVGEIAALNPGDDVEGGDDGSSSAESYTLTNAFNVANNNTYGWGNTINVMIADANLTANYNWTYYYWEITGTGNYISFDLYYDSTDNTLPTGTFTAADASSATTGNFIAGYETTSYGYTYDTGSCWYTVTDGTATDDRITDGTITITANSDGTYTIDIASSVANATYTGAITFTY